MNWKIIIAAFGGMIFGGAGVWIWTRKKYLLLKRKLTKGTFGKWEFPED